MTPVLRSNPGSGDHWGRFWAGCGVGVLVGLFVGVAALAGWLTPVPVTLPAAVPVILPVTQTTHMISTSVAVKVEYKPSLQGVIRRSGVLTELMVGESEEIKDGSLLARIDGHPVVAMVAEMPLWRDLSRGERGADVEVLQVWLRGLKHLNEKPDGYYGSSTVAAVQRWQRAIGENATGSFQVGSVIWVGKSAPAVARVEVSPGKLVSAGEAIFTAMASPSFVRVTEQLGGIGSGEEKVLVVGDISVPYVAGSGVVTDGESIEQLVAVIGASGEGAGRVQPKVPERVKVLPASAVVSDSAGNTCVFASDTSDPTLVTPIGGGVGGVTVPVDFSLETVLANPVEVRTELSCS